MLDLNVVDLETRILLNDECVYENMFGFGRKNKTNTLESVDESRRNFLKKSGIAAAGAFAATTLGMPKNAKAIDKRVWINDFAKNTIWRNYKEMQGVIDLMNAGQDMGVIEYAMYPDQNYYKKDSVFTMNNVQEVPKKDILTPQYWLLLRIYSKAAYGEYDIRFLHGGMGVTRPKEGTGLWYFARGLMDKHPDPNNREADLLKALYIGATGSENGAYHILNNTYMDLPEINKIVKLWKDKYNFAPHSNEGNHLAAYFNHTLRGNFKDPDLVTLALMVLVDLKNDERKIIYSGAIGDAVKRGNAPDYTISKNNSRTIPFNIFK